MTDQIELLRVAGQIVAAYVSRQDIPLEQIPSLVQKIYGALKQSSHLSSFSRVSSGPLTPAVPVDESITDDYIICLEDGKKLQMLKRHLSTVYKMTPEQYKERWGLPADYPIVSPRYARRRSDIAKTTGLGLTGRKKRTAANKVVSNIGNPEMKNSIPAA